MIDHFAAMAEQAGLDSETVSQLRDDLKSAVSEALDAAETEGGDPRSAIHTAVEQTLNAYGLEAPRPAPGQGRPQGDAPTEGSSETLAEQGNATVLDSLLELLDLVDETA